jgi:hypothetical protein
MKQIFTLLLAFCSIALFAQEPTPETTKAPEFVMLTAEITFEESSYDYGTIMDGDKVEHVYVFENTGSEPLVISNAKGSCGCTVPDWPKNPIAPGEKGEIKVVFNSKNKGKVGGRNQNKTVTITANTNPAETRIFIKGIVDKEE